MRKWAKLLVFFAMPRILAVMMGSAPLLGCKRNTRIVTTAPVPPGSQKLFTEISDRLPPQHVLSPWPDGTYSMPEVTAGGVALLDYDNDGRLDILQLCHPPPGAANQKAELRLYHQLPDGSFQDVTRAAGLTARGYWQGVAAGDIDNDGFPDLYITGYDGDRFFHNNGDGTFTDRTREAGLSSAPGQWGTSAAFFDYDRDGYLDLVVAHFGPFDPALICADANGRRDYCTPSHFPGALITLYHNNRDGTFTDVTARAGIHQPGRGWGVVCADLTGDGWPDIFVANDGQPAHLWVNQHDGTFSEEAMQRGCAVSGAGVPEAGMGIALGDVNGDGRLDLLVSHIAGEKATLYVGSPPQAGSYRTFSDQSAASGTAIITTHRTGWGCGFFDFDNDGNLDLAIVDGRVRRAAPLPGAAMGPFWNDYAENNLLFRGDGRGHFTDVTAQAGDFTRRIEVHHGLAFGDLDNDGGIDLVATTADNRLRLFHNTVPHRGHWLTVRALTGKRDAIGAQITITANGVRQMRLANPGYSFASSNDPRAHFGFGSVDRIDKIDVAWPDGTRESFPPPARIDRIMVVQQGQGTAITSPSRTIIAPPTASADR